RGQPHEPGQHQLVAAEIAPGLDDLGGGDPPDRPVECVRAAAQLQPEIGDVEKIAQSPTPSVDTNFVGISKGAAAERPRFGAPPVERPGRSWSTGGMTSAQDPGLAWLNALPAGDARRELHACLAASAWAETIAAHRPYQSRDALAEMAGAAFEALDWPQIEEALAAH